MTISTRKPRITFPENPYDGMQITEIIDDASCVIWTYRATTAGFIGLPQVIYTDQVMVEGNEVVPMTEDGEVFLQTQREDTISTGRSLAVEAWPSDVDRMHSHCATRGHGDDGLRGQHQPPPVNPPELLFEAQIEGLAVTKQEFTQSEAERDLEISKLEDKLDQVEGKVGHGKWKYDSVNINPRPGDFIMLGANSIATNDWSQALIIKFNTEDALGHNYNFHRAVEGDVIKLGYATSPFSQSFKSRLAAMVHLASPVFWVRAQRLIGVMTLSTWL